MNKLHINKGLINSLFALTFLLCASCKGNKETKASTETNIIAVSGYDFNNPVKYNMPDNLLEISGISFSGGNVKQTFAIQDEDGLIFKFALGDKNINGYKFAGKGDYEDLGINKTNVVVLKSNGALYTFPLNNIGTNDVAEVKEFKGLVPKAEYEGLFIDSLTNKVYVLNKESKETKQTPIFILNIDDKGVITFDSELELLNEDIEKYTDKKVKFRPSALAKNQTSKEWFILSSINKMIVITDENFKIKSVQKLDGNIFNQPEGIAFDSEQNLYISNEGADFSAGNILMFKYQK
jgi:uncharacterized protein YjiK